MYLCRHLSSCVCSVVAQANAIIYGIEKCQWRDLSYKSVLQLLALKQWVENVAQREDLNSFKVGAHRCGTNTS